VLSLVAHHPRWVTFLDGFVESKTQDVVGFLVMRRHGDNIGKLLGEVAGSFCTPQLRQFLAQIADGLSYLHGLGLLHADLKPQNVFAKWKGPILEFVIGDVGSATQVFGSPNPSQRRVSHAREPESTDSISLASSAPSLASVVAHVAMASGFGSRLALQTGLDCQRPSCRRAAYRCRPSGTDHPRSSGGTKTSGSPWMPSPSASCFRNCAGHPPCKTFEASGGAVGSTGSSS
jgi:serine/threonine protein kinase